MILGSVSTPSLISTKIVFEERWSVTSRFCRRRAISTRAFLAASVNPPAFWMISPNVALLENGKSPGKRTSPCTVNLYSSLKSKIDEISILSSLLSGISAAVPANMSRTLKLISSAVLSAFKRLIIPRSKKASSRTPSAISNTCFNVIPGSKPKIPGRNTAPKTLTRLAKRSNIGSTIY
ncbi:hypothetical protein D3C72_1259940 [compost metagenome]